MNEESNVGTIVLSYPTEPGVCAEQACEEKAVDFVSDSHFQRKFHLCRVHADVFDGIDRRQREYVRCPHRIDAQDNGVRPPSPPDWCVRLRGHEGEHRMWLQARHG